MDKSSESTLDSRALHSESLVIDGLLPSHTRPMGYTKRMEDRMDEMLDNKSTPAEILSEMEKIFNEQLYKGKTDYWEWWERSGVNVIHTTIGDVEGVSSERAYKSAIKEIAGWTRRFDYFDELVKVTDGDDIVKSWKEDKKGVILGFQNSHHLGKNLCRVEEFYNFGVRIIQLTYNLRNNVGDGCT